MNGSEGSSALTGAQQRFTDKTTMNYETLYTDASPIESSPHENSNQSGTTLKEHDYIGLSEVSSANSSNDKQQPESGLREALDLNESATALCLGLKPTGKASGDDQESMTFGNATESYRTVLEPSAEHERSHAGSKLDGPVSQDVNATLENPAKRAAYHHQQQQQDGREPVAEPEFAKSLLGGIQRSNAILQEFRKVQAMKAAQHSPHAQVMKTANLNRPMHHRPQDYDAGQKGKYPNSLTTHAPYNNAFPGVKNNGVKRGFSEAVGMNHTGLSGPSGVAREGHGDVNRGEGMGMGMGGTDQQDVKVKSQQGGKPWIGASSFVNKSPAWQNLSLDKPNPFNVRRTLLNKVQDAGDSSNKEANKHGLNDAVAPPSNVRPPSPAQNQTVGWPPVRNFVRNNNPVRPAPPPSAPAPACPSVQGKGGSSSTTTNSWFVKIYMDGVPFGRKVDLKTNNSYELLYPALEEMFQQFINGQYSGSRTSSSAESHFVSTSRKLNFLDGSEYVLIYEDHEGDFMLVGDVPWELFINAVKRLRIMKGSEEVNLAPKNAAPMKPQAAVGR